MKSVLLLEGCAMRVLYPEVHAATRRVLAHAGFSTLDVDLGCCGALEAHAGQLDAGVKRAQHVKALAAGRPIVANSAGCGSWLKEQGIPGVCDLSEFLLENGLLDKLATSRFSARVTYHDACHLAHAQGIREQPRALLRAIPGLELIEMRDSDRCCGSAGIYNLTEPELALQMVETKWNEIEATGAEIVVQGNPGCQSWLEQNARPGTRVVHLAEILDEALANLNGSHVSN
jgi:glycolate oxidase iron-sulfur subunit